MTFAIPDAAEAVEAVRLASGAGTELFLRQLRSCPQGQTYATGKCCCDELTGAPVFADIGW
jgi:hypothetical protein